MIVYWNMSMKNYFEFAVVTIILMITGQQAHAYIDPGSGSLIMTAIMGFIAAIGFTFRKYFYKLRSLSKKKDTAESNNCPESNEE